MLQPDLPVLVIGEALADLVSDSHGGRHVYPGGSPANTAIGLARLGHSVHLATRLGGDPYGAMIRKYLHGAGVLLTKGSAVSERTSRVTVTLDDKGRARYDFDVTWSLPPSVVDLARVRPFGHVHTGAIAATMAPGAARVRAGVLAARPVATISYDPHLRPALLGSPAEERPKVEALVAASDLVKVSDEDLAWLYPDQAPDRVAAGWVERGPALVVLTCGADGSRAYWRNGHLDVAAAPVDVVDTVGAGDAFMSGLISGLLSGGLLGAGPRDHCLVSGRSELLAATSARHPSAPLVQALEHAAHSAAITCGRPGSDPPTTAELTCAIA